MPARPESPTADAAPTPPFDGDDPRLAGMAAALTERLRPACAHWDEASFAALVQQIARLKLRWHDAERRAAAAERPPAPPDQAPPTNSPARNCPR